MNEPLSAQDERIRQAVHQLFAEAKHISEITYERVLALADGQGEREAFKRVLSYKQFRDARHSWLQERVEKAITTAFATAQIQGEVSLQQIADLAGCSIDSVKRLGGEQFRAHCQALATPQEQALQVIERLVEAKIPLREYTWERVLNEVGKFKHMYRSAELGHAFREGYEALARYHKQQWQQRVPDATYACIQGDWINVDEPVWYLPTSERILRRDHLRPDIGAISWPLLREEALMTAPSPHTLYMHHHSCIFVAKLLGDIVPDIRLLTLETLQRAWLATKASEQMRKQGRTMLVRLLETLMAQGTPQQVQEYARAIQWLQLICIKESITDKAYLSEAEFDALLDGCLEDIIQGLAYTRSAAHQIVPTDMCTREVEAVFYWGVALIILIMAFTGLRRQSIARLTVKDVAQIGPQAFALAWRHGKPGKERIAVIPALVAEHIQHYIEATASIRTHMETQHIFFARNQVFHWDQMTVTRLSVALDTFVRRHALIHSGSPLQLGATLLRRTYVTRALYELPSIAALQAQLGHSDPKTTLLYAQHDRYAHPAQVEEALNAFGRKVLVRWRVPLLLDDLPDGERQVLLGARIAHEQEVGLCRHDCCVKLDEERLPPCSLCEHLVSGREYVVAWEREKVFREQQLEHLSQAPGAELLLAQMKGQYDRFLINYRFVKERSQV